MGAPPRSKVVHWRRIFFWSHLVVGIAVGIVIAFLALTGAVLAFQDSIVLFAERGTVVPAAASACVAPSALLSNASVQRGDVPTTLQLSADPHEPALVTFADSYILQLDPCGGMVLGPAANRLRIFFSSVRDLHRWLALSRGGHENLRSIKNAANLAFSFLILSGLILWLPRQWRAANLRAVLLVRKKLHGRAREWNLHNVAGVWMAIPLLLISLSGSVMAYGWANALLYKVSGTSLPQEAARDRKLKQPSVDFNKLDPLIVIAKSQDPAWRHLQLRLPAKQNQTVTFTLDDGDPGRPQQRTQLVLSKTGTIVRWEPFDRLSRGRQWRLYARFLHTGELFGVPGKVVAFLAALAALLLVWTGFSLALRRLSAWRERTQRSRRNAINSAVSTVA